MKANKFIFVLLFTLQFIVFTSCKKVEDKIGLPEKEKQTEKVKEPENKPSADENKTAVEDNKQPQVKTQKYEPDYNTYENARFGFSLKYPSDVLKKNHPANGDGLEFVYADGFNIKVYGSNGPGVEFTGLNDLYDRELKSHKDITYKVRKDNWFVVSGYDGTDIFYIKTYAGKSCSNTLEIVYPSNLRDKYYDAITIISKSFKNGNLNEFQ